MIVLDTNVVSELMKPLPSPIVLQWIASRDRMSLYTTSVTPGGNPARRAVAADGAPA